MDDARKAAEAAGADPRVEQVLVFGSVARGEASEWSDIDLLVLIGDISNEEWEKASHEIRSDVNLSCCEVWGKPIDILVQRRADFEHLSTNVTASFEYVAWGDAVVLYQSSPEQVPARCKVDGVPLDNQALAAEYVDSASPHIDTLLDIIRGIPIKEAEDDTDPPGDRHSIDKRRKNRYCKLLEEAHMVIEQSFRAVASSSEGLSLGKGHQIDDYLSMMDDTPERSALAEAVETLRMDNKELKSWRLVAYTRRSVEWMTEATSENASAHIEVALVCSRIAINAVETRAGRSQSVLDTMAETRKTLARLEDLPRTPAELESGPAALTKGSRRSLEGLLGAAATRQKKDQQISPPRDTSQYVVGLPFSHDELVEAGSALSGGGGKCGYPTPDGEHKTCQNPHPGSGRTCSAGHQR